MRIHQNNVKSYLKQTYGCRTPILKQQQKLEDFPVLLQADYGEVNDCTLTSMTAIVYFLSQKKYSINDIYAQVEKIAKKYGYKGTRGTPYVTIRKIFHEALKKFKLPKAYVKYKAKFKYIQQQIGRGNPLILSIQNDGRDYYINHSVTVVGYEIYECGDRQIPMILIQDNWYKSIGYIDFERISGISAIHYSELTSLQKLCMWRKLKNLK